MLNSMDVLIREYGMFPRGTKVLCAVSGGADSVCLLHRLCHLRDQLGIEVAAAHYNHNLRGAESDGDEAFVRELAAGCCPEISQVELFVGRGDVTGGARETGRGLEETAREMRYAFLQETARRIDADVIATAHNLNDNAETILLHLVRGTGLRGLTGIAPVRGNIVRPLLNTSRHEIEEYLREHAIPYRNDSTNRDDAYTRNRIRHRIIPELEDICPGFLTRMNQTAANLQLDELCLMEQAQQIAAAATVWEGNLSISAQVIAQAPDAIAVRAVRILIGRQTEGNDNCSAAHLKALLDLCRKKDPSARVDLPDGLRARREYDRLVLTRQTVQPLTDEIALQLPGVTWTGAYRLESREVVFQGEEQGTYAFFLSKELAGAIQVRSRRIGDRLTRPNRMGKTVKKLLIDEKIPLSDRDELPVLEVAGQAAAVAGLGPDVAFLPQVGEPAWQIIITPLRERSV